MRKIEHVNTLKQFEYKGFEADLTLDNNQDIEFVASLSTTHFEKFTRPIRRNTESELKVALQDLVDEYYRENKKHFPSDLRTTTKAYWLLGVFSALWMAFIALSYLLGIAPENSVGLPNEIWWSTYSTFFNNFSAPVISLLSFIALLWTIFQQNKSHNVSLEELRLTREEIELTRDEMAKATIAHENQAFALQEQVEDAKNTAIEQKDLAELQSRATQLQQFENTFYSLLAEHNQLLLQISNNKYLVNVVNEERGAHNTAMSTLRRELLLDPNVCRYYRTLYQLLKFIARNHPGNSEKTYNNEYLNGLVLEGEKSYSSLVRSTIPTNVLLALAINCVDGYEETHAFHKYFLLVERFNFLEHLVFAKYINYARRGGFSEISHPNVYYTILGTYSKKSFDKNESSKVRLQELETLLDKKDDGLLRLIAANPPRENSALDVLVKQHGDQV